MVKGCIYTYLSTAHSDVPKKVAGLTNGSNLGSIVSPKDILTFGKELQIISCLWTEAINLDGRKYI